MNMKFGAIIMVAIMNSAVLTAENINVSMSLVPPRTFPGQPIFVDMSFQNTSDNPLVLDLGWNRKEAFSFLISDASGKKVAEGLLKKHGGISRSGQVALAVGATVTQRVVLSQYCPTCCSEGEYTVICNVKLPGIGEYKVNSRLSVHPAKPNEIEAYYKGLGENYDAADIARKFEIIDAFICARNAQAVPWLLKLLDSDSGNERQVDLAFALAEIGTEPAVKGIIALMANARDQRERDVYLAALFRVADVTKDEMAKQMAAKAIDGKKRPPIAEKID
jgi:hypothetical protein